MTMNCNSTVPSNCRHALGFESSAIKAFSFLNSEYGFRIAEQSSTFLGFESDRVFVNVYHGRSSYEVGVEIGKIADDPGGRFRLPSVIAALSGQHECINAVLQASKPETVRDSLRKLATLIAVYCGDLLHADDKAFEKVRVFAKRMNDEITEHYAHAALRRQAEGFWQEKKYAHVLRLYEQFDESLTPMERRRMEFARKRVE